MKKINKGFTLIELLVVISIISLLSSIILAAVQDARAKAQDSKIISQLIEMRKLAEISKTKEDNYGVGDNHSCGDLVNVFYENGYLDNENWPSISGVSGIPICYSDSPTGLTTPIKEFSIWYPLNNSKGWCVDSDGNSMAMSSEPDSSNCMVAGTNPEYTLTLTNSYYASEGTLVVYPDLLTYSYNTEVTITAYPNPSWNVMWNSGCDSNPAQNECIVIMDGNKTVSYEWINY